ncbi:transglutaminase-like cysteine peptidase [Ancylobacter rudongensis]|jgi:predicted transglutaminase-like cysteine proteinase|uniref:Predicted transglutaminase-like cysteine proteinase n=1 Tax=Ancylobacter rudongensis TaxID=177413 RepID=A0A1G4Q5P7_9HYPH|nr:transglutaminase-like cysteine peptidase [Ancylobacter rudongensis]RTL93152.1 transglutaminase [Ancylobacter aquaticus]SCW39777.1 Predicted transglutaminase-like cysteine proteinase [Ancylobacter rudongensis]
MKKRLERALLAAGQAIVAATVAAVLTHAAPAQAEKTVAMLSSFAANMAAGAHTTVPMGYFQFCAEHPADCGPRAGSGGKVALTEANYAQLREVNDAINGRIQPMTDVEHYGEIERWTYPDDGFGDCEDYVLLKRRTLVALGWPGDTLLVTVVRDHKGDGHAVLTVVTDRGDLVLDNQEAAILLWHETGYRFVKRQAQHDTDSWVSLGDVLAPLSVGRN